MNKRVFFIAMSITLVVAMLGIHLSLLIKISKIQRDIKKIELRVVETKKELQAKNSEFEKRIDFKKIRKKAEDDFGMEISDHIEYLRVD
ncbi:hypothetical protein PM10SUCC1_13820 [Propionigenium maris DSM 9537]|uniref:Septum formation initiator n=1 Tax=Propionigenium maris DSM 9537 TaxID=1123000 RepID=A0A9W6GIL8_9FUSO|nr:hypothetical protein [Propionigenium maris]GLI55868.1 hypothetical protein PM10SUCC1_13820 [Propionigenium maris DSM 9537]